MGAELFRTVGLTDITKLIVYFLNFDKAPRNASYDVQISVYTFETVDICLSNSTIKKKTHYGASRALSQQVTHFRE